MSGPLITSSDKCYILIIIKCQTIIRIRKHNQNECQYYISIHYFIIILIIQIIAEWPGRFVGKVACRRPWFLYTQWETGVMVCDVRNILINYKPYSHRIDIEHSLPFVTILTHIIHLLNALIHARRLRRCADGSILVDAIVDFL